MPRDEKEPQSYGSQSDWTTGHTGETPSREDGEPASQADFYDSRRESETNAARQGGFGQPEWTDHVDVLRPAPVDPSVDDHVRKVTADKGGAKREGFFKRRDYE